MFGHETEIAVKFTSSCKNRNFWEVAEDPLFVPTLSIKPASFSWPHLDAVLNCRPIWLALNENGIPHLLRHQLAIVDIGELSLLWFIPPACPEIKCVYQSKIDNMNVLATVNVSYNQENLDQIPPNANNSSFLE